MAIGGKFGGMGMGVVVVQQGVGWCVHFGIGIFGKLVQDLLGYFHLIKTKEFEICLASFDPALKTLPAFFLYDLIKEQDQDTED